jgi:hypothetical protein
VFNVLNISWVLVSWSQSSYLRSHIEYISYPVSVPSPAGFPVGHHMTLYAVLLEGGSTGSKVSLLFLPASSNLSVRLGISCL